MTQRGDDRIAALRREIDQIDDQLLELILERVAAVRRIGTLKARQGQAVMDPVREEEILQRLMERARGHLSPDQVRRVFAAVFALSREVQTRG
jgi:chorismate mutase